MEKDPLFHRDPAAWSSIPEQRERAVLQNNALFHYNFITEDDIMQNPSKIHKLSELLAQFDLSMSARLSLSNQVFANAVLTLGTDRHQKYYDGTKNNEIFGAFCLTEMAHGSNTQKMATTATFDPKSQEFVINTPRPEDM